MFELGLNKAYPNHEKKGAKAMRSVVVIAVMMFVSIVDVAKSATLESAQRDYDGKNYREAAAQYGTLLTLNWPKAKLSEIYDRFTDCLVMTGQYDLAEAKIDAFLKIMPSDPASAKMTARKEQIARQRSSALQTASATIESANQAYDAKDFISAAAQYESVAARTPSISADFYDKMTESLIIAGKLDSAQDKIDVFLSKMPADALCATLLARKARIAFYRDDYPSAIRYSKGLIIKNNSQSEAGLQAIRILVDALAKSGNYQELIATIDFTLSMNANHPMYAELCRRQAETFSRLKQNDAARAKYKEAIKHAALDTDTYESCVYRLSELTMSQGKVTSESLYYLNEFINHPGADKIYPANAKRRIVALRKLKKYDVMEQEAARYLSDENYVLATESINIKNLIGPLIDFQHGPYSDAIWAVKNSYYEGDYVAATAKAKALMDSQSAESAEYQQAQSLYISALSKKGDKQALIDYVDQALSANPNHPMYAEYRRCQADTLYDQKQEALAQAKYTDALAHTSNETETYEWCCYRAGDALFRQAAKLYRTDPKMNAELKTQGKVFMQQYVNLPSKDKIYPDNVQRRMLAFVRLGQIDKMELEAAHYLGDVGAYTSPEYANIMRALSVNRTMRQNSDLQGAFAAFDQLRVHENDLKNADVKVYCGITMLKSADALGAKGLTIDRVGYLKSAGRKFLLDATKDESLKLSNRLDAYYFLGNWPKLSETVTANLDKTPLTDFATRSELMNWKGIATAYQKDVDGALACFDQVLADFEKHPEAVGERAIIAAHWGITLNLDRKNQDLARQYYVKLSNMPNGELKSATLRDYQFLTGK